MKFLRALTRYSDPDLCEDAKCASTAAVCDKTITLKKIAQLTPRFGFHPAMVPPLLTVELRRVGLQHVFHQMCQKSVRRY
jgi:hypothetical protein